jgi:hypothetical protein
MVTSTYLRAIANRLMECDLGLEFSLSARLFSLHFTQENPYDVWAASVPSWIRGELDNGLTVIIADIRNYFGSVVAQQIEAALQRGALENKVIDEILLLLGKLNSFPSPDNTSLPVQHPQSPALPDPVPQ